jgi:hypothetical protein
MGQSFLSQVFGCMGKSPVVEPTHVPKRRAAATGPKRMAPEDVFEPRPRRITPVAPRLAASNNSFKQLQRSMALALPERGDYAWRLGNHIKVLQILETCAAEALGPSADPNTRPCGPEAHALGRHFVALLEKSCGAVEAAQAQVDALCPQTIRSHKNTSQTLVLDAVDIAIPLSDFHALAQDYARLCALFPSGRRNKLCTELQSFRASTARAVAMPEQGKLLAAFGTPRGSLTEQRRLKNHASAALTSLRARLDEAAQAVEPTYTGPKLRLKA